MARADYQMERGSLERGNDAHAYEVPQSFGATKWSAVVEMSNCLIDAKLDSMTDRILGAVDPTKTEQSIAASAARIAGIESQVTSAAEVGAAAQPILAALERMEARLAALEARPSGGCCVVS